MSLGRRWMTLPACLVMAAALPGCYESSSPLSPPGKVRHDAGLIGSWRCLPDGTRPDEHGSLEVFSFDDAQYYAEWREEEETTRYRAYGSQVGGVILLNVQELKAGSPAGKWVFLRYRLETPRSLKVGVVRQDSVKGLDEADALRAIRKRAADDALYEPLMACSREDR